LLLAGPADAQEKIEIRFGTTNPPGGMQYFSGEEWVKRVNEKAGDLDAGMLQKVRLRALEVSQPPPSCRRYGAGIRRRAAVPPGQKSRSS
jgi:hypothetical protein